MSSPRPFFVGNRRELLENSSDDPNAQSIPLDVTINGRIEKKGDVDEFQFEAKEGQRIVIECWAERIESRLRAVLEILDARGKRLASNRGYFGIDPLIDFRVPADGKYIVKLYDLVYAGGAEFYYRLDIDTGPRVAFAVPAVVERGKPASVTLYGWNFAGQGPVPTSKSGSSKNRSKHGANEANQGLDCIQIEIPANVAQPQWPLPVRLQSQQTCIEGFPYRLPGSHAPIMICVTDVPVVTANLENYTPKNAQPVTVPCEVSGQIVTGNEQHWFRINARRGEVFYLEGFGQRIKSPIDLDVRILDAAGEHELASFSDELRNVGGTEFPTSHLDPAGRWVAPSDGRYLILVRNVIGGQRDDVRRVYRLSVRREEPDFDLAVIPRRNDSAGLNVQRGGRTIFDVIAFRRRGLGGSIQVKAEQLPMGIQCPDVWLGPGVNRTAIVVSAGPGAQAFAGQLSLFGTTNLIERRKARGGVVVRTGTPNGWSRITSEVPLAVAGAAPLRITANGHETRDHHLYGDLKVRHSPGGILDVAVHVERQENGHQAPVKLIGVGLPELIQNQTATIPAGKDKGYISFYLPPNLPIGQYSLAVRAETTIPAANGKNETVTVYSNIVSFAVHQPAFRISVDPYAPRRIRRGEVVQVGYTVRRINGFISKIHTELATPDKVTEVIGLRARGSTSVGQTEKSTLQIIANDNAPLGQQPFLRLYGVGTLEDKAIYHGSCFLNLEVVE